MRRYEDRVISGERKYFPYCLNHREIGAGYDLFDFWITLILFVEKQS